MEIREQVPLASYTSFHIGGPARYFVEVASDHELSEAVSFAHDRALPILILGGGSNVLIADEGFDGLVIRMANKKRFWKERARETIVIVEAGGVWDELVDASVSRGLWGIENLSSIPGSVGASVVQNIGAYGVEVSGVVEWVEVYDMMSREMYRLTRDACHFGYRDSIFKQSEGKQLIVLRVAFRLTQDGVPNINYKDLLEYHAREFPIRKLRDVREAIVTIRSRKFPNYPHIGTAGSFFKNPIVNVQKVKEILLRFPDAPHFPQEDGRVKLSSAWLIDHVLHMKGVRKGDVGTWEKQALVMINYGTATASDIKNFALHIIESCVKETGIQLEPEVVYVEN